MSSSFEQIFTAIEDGLGQATGKRSSSPFVIRRRSPRATRRSRSRSRSPRRRSSSPRRRSSSPRRSRRSSSPRRSLRSPRTPMRSPRRSSGSVRRSVQQAVDRLSQEASYTTPIRRSPSRRSSSPASLASRLPRAAKAARSRRYKK